MAKIKHIALTTENPGVVAEFYKNAFDMEEIRRSDSGAVFELWIYKPGYTQLYNRERLRLRRRPRWSQLQRYTPHWVPN